MNAEVNDPRQAVNSGHDEWPFLRGPQLALWLITPVALIMNMYGGWIVFLALLSGVLRKFGKPTFSKQDLRKYMFHQDF